MRRYKRKHEEFPIYRTVAGRRVSWCYAMDETSLQLWQRALYVEASQVMRTTTHGRESPTRHARRVAAKAAQGVPELTG